MNNLWWIGGIIILAVGLVWALAPFIDGLRRK